MTTPPTSTASARALGGAGLAVALLLAACAPLSPAPTRPERGPPAAPAPQWPAPPPPAPQPPARPPVPPAPKPAPPPTQAAVDGLLAQAWRHHERGDDDAAIAVAERAQRLDPRNAEAYLVLATSHFAQAENALAEQLVRRGLAFSAPGSLVRLRLQQLLDRLD